MAKSEKPLEGVRLVSTSRTGIDWPAIPGRAAATILALQYQLEDSQWWPAETLQAAQLRQLELVLGHALRSVPFYRERLAFLNGAKRGTLTPETVARIPILRRADIQDAGDSLTSRNIPANNGKVQDIRTSGSTGRPITVKGTNVTAMFVATMLLRYHVWHGRRFSGTVCCIRNLTGNLVEAAKSGKAIPWAPGFHSGRMFPFNITSPIREQLEWLVERDPDYLLTFPSNLAALLRHSEEIGIKPKRLTQVATMSETLDPAVRETCRRVWDASISDAYSSEEVGMIAIQCPENDHYHVQAENLFVEILDEDGMPCRPGEIGRMVLSDLHNLATPLIRYEIGDYAEVGEACSCGRGLPVLNRIAGRVRNMLTLPSGDKFWPSFPEDKMMPIAPIRQFQVIQHDLERVEAKLVPGRDLSDDEVANLRTFLAGCLRHDFKLDLVFVDEIPRLPGGKYEDFISRVAG